MVPRERGRLTERLKRALAQPVTVVVGPAGCGKSVALFDALSAGPRPFARFDVGPEHRRLSAFVQGLAEAVAPWAPGARVAFASAYSRALVSTDPTQTLAVWFQEHVRDLDLTIAFDNMHHADAEPAIHAFVVRTIERALPSVRWAIAARSTHFLPLAGWLAYEHMDLPLTENELAFNAEEIAELARANRIAIGSADAIRERTNGWATGVAFLLRDGGDPSDAAPIRAIEPLVERILADLDPEDLRAMLPTYYLPELTVELLLAIGGPSLAASLRELRARAPFLFVDSGRAPRYHDRFRAALRSRLASIDPERKRDAIESAAFVLDHYRRFVEFLTLQLELGDPAACIPVLAEHGIELVEQGHADLVEAVVVALQYASDELPASIVALRAILDSRLGRFDTAESWFTQAISRAPADDPRTIEFKYLYACDLLRRDREDCLPLLQEHARDERLSPELQAGISSALAEAYQLAGRASEARDEIARALELDRSIGDEGLHARVIVRASYVYLYQGDYAQAERAAREAVTAAAATSQFLIATAAHSVLYVVAFDTENVVVALHHLEKLLESCLKSGNLQFQFYCLACALEIEVERGNDAAIARIDETLRSFDVSYESSVSDEAFLPGDAMRSAARGDFARAFRLLHPTAPHQASADRIALRWAEVAFYAAGSLQRDEAAQALERGLEALAAADRASNRTRRARIFLAIASSLLDRGVEGRALLDDVAAERDLPERVRAIANAATALCAYVGGASNHGEVAAALRELRERECGGIAKLFEALPSRQSFALGIPA